MTTVADIFGIDIEDYSLFEHALTHPSCTKDAKLPYDTCYERYEFLGDAVLKLAVSDVLFKMYPEATEGQLSKIRSIIVSDATLAQISKKNGLKDLIIVAKHEEKQGCRELDSVNACVFEAILGAYYLEGNYKKIVEYVENNFAQYIDDVCKHFEKYNAKEKLQEYTQAINKLRPEYKIVSETGPAHKKVFEVEVSYDGEILAVEKGLSKKDAEQKAAFAACQKLGIIK